jgi:exodeoxyribonuclease VII large subunit
MAQQASLSFSEEPLVLGVSDAIALINQTLEYAYPTLTIEGEVSGFKVNKDRYVFFDIKDENGTLGCFMTVYQLRIPIEDGMRVRVVTNPKLTQWGKFSLTVRQIAPVGQGSLKRAFELLRAKLDNEGLFADERKRPLPVLPQRIGVISSTEAAGYADFIKILNDRWGGIEVVVANTQVQGIDAPAQMVRALEYLNQMAEPPEVIALIRGGGSADDLSAFNDEPLVRTIAGSRVPVIVGVGHEVDTTLADMVADVRAATPSNAAQILVPHRREVQAAVDATVQRMLQLMKRHVEQARQYVDDNLQRMQHRWEQQWQHVQSRFEQLQAVLNQLDPRSALKRGYAIVRANNKVVRSGAGLSAGDELSIEIQSDIIKAGVINVSSKK